MKCIKCESEKPPHSPLCGKCGDPMNPPNETDSMSLDMDAEIEDVNHTTPIPKESIETRQSNWAYMLPAIPWLGLLIVSMVFEFFTFGVLPTIFATYIIGSRYLSFRKTVYILTDRYVIIIKGSLTSQNRIDISFSDISGVLVQPGTFGKFLGYTRVRFQLKNDKLVFLQYISLSSPFLHHLRKRFVI